MKAVTNFRILAIVFLIAFEGVVVQADIDDDDDEDSFCYKVRAAAIAGGALLGGAATIAAVPAVVGAAGFTASGVASGSIAAGMQSTIGSVAGGSYFATLQSIGAAGLGFGAKSVLGAIGGTLGLGFVERMSRCFDEKEEVLDEEENEINVADNYKEEDADGDSETEEKQYINQEINIKSEMNLKQKSKVIGEDVEDEEFWASIPQ